MPYRYEQPRTTQSLKIGRKVAESIIPRKVVSVFTDSEKSHLSSASRITGDFWIGAHVGLPLPYFLSDDPRMGFGMYAGMRIAENVTVLAKKYKQAKITKKEKKQRMEPLETHTAHIKAIEETDTSYIPDSALSNYWESMHGFAAFLDHIKTANVPKKIVDIGTGNGIALSQLVNSPLGEDVSFIGTALTNSSELQAVLPIVPVVITQVEKLAIQKNSVGGILARESIGFSNHPELVVENMDRVLAPGGVIKATFKRKKGSYGRKWNRKYENWGYHTHEQFSLELSKRGYDVAILETDGDDILLAIKPDGIKREMSGLSDAWQLLAADNIIYHKHKSIVI